MPLPVTKAELNRLGDRLRDSQAPSSSDLELLAGVLAAYRENLEQAETHLRGLGYAPTTRVKTTPTMTDKLRRTHGMELARMQDLAGARIVVDDFTAQDEAARKISGLYQKLGCRCRLIDRRADPRYGYRAVHLIVHIDQMPLEIQIRTQMQDTWANIVERLADRWGRGIRYGQDPEGPDWLTERKDFITALINLSDQTAPLEGVIARIKIFKRNFDDIAYSLIGAQPAQTIEHDTQARIRNIAGRSLEAWSGDVDPEIREILDQREDITYAQAGRLIETSRTVADDYIRQVNDTLRRVGQTLSDTIQQIARAEGW
jgi:Region found in RelA / SpoT proteins